MIAIKDKLVSRDLVDKDFVCNLNKCKGMCCVLGDQGATVEKEEAEILEKVYDKVKPYLTEKGIAEIEKRGVVVLDKDGIFETPLVDNKECAYVAFDEKGVALCGIEMAQRDGLIDFKKPVSCHLYPVRITKYEMYDAVNYEKWEICKPACTLGKELSVPVYKFLKEPLIRKYGEGFYEELDRAAQHLNDAKKED